jgi:NADPH:quinone reductase-like Zn-dependent oxidoreductase
MKAIGHREAGGVEVLTDIEIACPSPGRDLLVSVRAFSVKPVDVKRRQRAATADDYLVLSFDAADVVEAVFLVKPGDAVFYAAAGSLWVASTSRFASKPSANFISTASSEGW